MKALYAAVTLAVTALLGSGCGSAVDSVAGRIVFTGTVTAVPGVSLVTQVSVDEFATILASTRTTNEQGFLAVPFKVDNIVIPSGSPFLMVRSFQDSNGNFQWDSGEGSGRFDQTTTGNSTFSLLQLDKVGEEAWLSVFTDSADISEIDIHLDTTSGL